MGRCAVVVELQRHADDVVAGRLDERRDDGGIDPARHGDEDAGRRPRAFKAEIDVHHERAPEFPEYSGKSPASKANSLPNLKGIQGGDLGDF